MTGKLFRFILDTHRRPSYTSTPQKHFSIKRKISSQAWVTTHNPYLSPFLHFSIPQGCARQDKPGEKSPMTWSVRSRSGA